MTEIQPVTLQSLSVKLGEELAIRSCLPIAFYMMLKANDYLPDGWEPDQFMVQLDRAALTSGNKGWSRPALTSYMRQKYQAEVVSWWLNGVIILENMKKSGYIKTDREIKYLHDHIEGNDLRTIVNQGYPVIVTTKPGFGGTGSDDLHAVIILEWTDTKITLVDPDARNSRTEFKPSEVTEFLHPNGAGSVVLPRHE